MKRRRPHQRKRPVHLLRRPLLQLLLQVFISGAQ